MIINSSIKKYNIEFYNNFNIEQLDYNTGDIIIIDKNVKLKLPQSLTTVEIDATEKTKSYDYLPIVMDKILSKSFTRKNKLTAIGGGITQDIVSFISSILFRGVDWIFLPTTLLAQGDSCIGGKTSINYRNYKNQLGNFNPPNKIIICNEFLDSLNTEDIQSGLGEMLHFYLVSGQDDFNFYKDNYLTSKQSVIKRCLEIKKGFVERDEFDKGERLLLNYGHTFGHAIESIIEYKYPHGICVCFGMDIANFISMKIGYISEKLYKELNKFLTGIHNKKLPDINIDKFIKALEKDKKNDKKGFINCVLTQGIGKMFLMNTDIHFIRQCLEEYGFNK